MWRFRRNDDVPRKISKMERRKDVAGLVKVLQAKDDMYMRYEAAKALCRLKDARAVMPLIETISHIIHEPQIDGFAIQDKNIRGAAIEALGAIHDSRAVEPLINSLRNDEYNRREAVIALGQLGDTRAIPALNEALKDKYWVVRSWAVDALDELGCKPSTDQLLQINYDLMSNFEPGIRDDAATELLEIGGAEGIRWLLRALADGDPNRFKAAAWALVNSHRIDTVKQSVGEKEFNRIISGAMAPLIEKISNATLQPGVNYLDEVTARTLQVLKEYGDATLLPALYNLLEKVTNRRREEGYRAEYVQTATYGGRIDNDGNIETIESIIETIKARTATG